MNFELLADHPEAATQVGRWYWDTWGRAAGTSLEESICRTAEYSSRSGPPLIVLAERSGAWVAAAQLKVREMDIYPDFEFWLGGVFVAGPSRGQGIAGALVEEVASRALEAGIDRLYLQTEALDGGLYAGCGFEPLEAVTYQGIQVLVMSRSLGE